MNNTRKQTRKQTEPIKIISIYESDWRKINLLKAGEGHGTIADTVHSIFEGVRVE